MTKDTGGPAFPIMWEYAENETGMTLRDYFAAQALSSLLATGPSGVAALNYVAKTNKNSSVDSLAQIAYDMADAMLKARKE